jgi:ribosomal protein S27AE
MGTKLYDISDWCNKGADVKGYPYIGEINIKLSMGAIVRVDDDFYAIGVLERNAGYAGVRKIEINFDPEDESYTNNLTCPYCGFEDADSWELSDGEDEHECGRCGATMSFERIVSVEYSSSAVRPPEIVEAKWRKGESV